MNVKPRLEDQAPSRSTAIIHHFMAASQQHSDLSDKLDYFTTLSADAGYAYMCYLHVPALGTPGEDKQYHMSLNLPPELVETLSRDVQALCDPIVAHLAVHAMPLRISDLVAVVSDADPNAQGGMLSDFHRVMGEGIAMPLFGPGGRFGCAILGTGDLYATVSDTEMFQAWSFATWAHLTICEAKNRANPGPRLSPRETEVLDRLARGQSNGEIARELEITPNTVATHLRRIFLKLDVRDRTTALLRAMAHNQIR